MHEDSNHDGNSEGKKNTKVITANQSCLDVKEGEGLKSWTVACLHWWICTISNRVHKHNKKKCDFLSLAAVRCRCAVFQYKLIWLITSGGFCTDENETESLCLLAAQ